MTRSPIERGFLYAMPRGQGFTFAGEAHPFKVVPIPFLASVVGKWIECVAAQGDA